MLLYKRRQQVAIGRDAFKPSPGPGVVVDAVIIIYNERGAETNRRATPKTIRSYCRDLYIASGPRAGIGNNDAGCARYPRERVGCACGAATEQLHHRHAHSGCV